MTETAVAHHDEPHRLLFYCSTLDDPPKPRPDGGAPDYEADCQPGPVTKDRYPASPDEANLVSSIVAGTDGDLHMPVLDIDGVNLEDAIAACVRVGEEVGYSFALSSFVSVPSSTPGNHHLFIEHAMAWDKYVYFLWHLVDASILEEGYVRVSELRQATFVRKPGVTRKVPRA